MMEVILQVHLYLVAENIILVCVSYNGILYIHMYAIFSPLFRNTFHPEGAQGYRLI